MNTLRGTRAASIVAIKKPTISASRLDISASRLADGLTSRCSRPRARRLPLPVTPISCRVPTELQSQQRPTSDIGDPLVLRTTGTVGNPARFNIHTPLFHSRRRRYFSGIIRYVTRWIPAPASAIPLLFLFALSLLPASAFADTTRVFSQNHQLWDRGAEIKRSSNSSTRRDFLSRAAVPALPETRRRSSAS